MSTSNPQPLKSANLPDVDQVLGLAIFDSNCLPTDYFITKQHEDIEWIQLVFQSLGLHQLLVSTLKLPELDHATIRTKVGNVVVICRGDDYVALLLKRALPQEHPQVDADWVECICDFEANVVRAHPNFRAV